MDNTYTVLARKYRSQDFLSLIGQNTLVKTLTNAINSGRIAHAYIFTGIRGTGKTSTARILAKALNCLASDKATPNPCGICENCRAIALGQHIDVMEIDAASHTGVDNMRDILDAAQYRPTNGRYKVYIIDEVHMLSKSAFNALLKTLEEPPAHVIFILATTEIHEVPLTILSRCQRFDLARVSVEELKKHFLKISSLENIELSDSAAELLAREADGSVRDGLSLLDQAIAQTGGKITEQAILDMLKRTDRNVVLDFMKIILSGDIAKALTKTDEIYNNGADLSLFLKDMLEWTHWATRMHPVLHINDINNAPYTSEQREQIIKIDSNIQLNTLSRLWQVMVAAIPEMQNSTNPKQTFDMLVIRLMHIANIPPISELIKQQNCNTRSQIPVNTAPIETNKFITISSVENLASELQKSRELLLYSHYTNNIEIIELFDSAIKYFDRKSDAEFPKKLSAWLFNKTGKQWTLTACIESNNNSTVTEKKHAELVDDPMIKMATSLFSDAELSESKN